MSTSNSGERAYHRAYANPTEDQAIANIMREEARKKRMARQQEKVRRNNNSSDHDSHGGHPGGIRYAEK